MEDHPPNGMMRDGLAFLTVLLACPIAVWGGSTLACIGQPGLFTACAMNAAFIGPLLLVVAGVVAGIATRGWTGMALVQFATFGGMVLILLLATVAGRPVPVDWFSGIVATIWFSLPIQIGYGIARLGARIRRRVGRPRG